MGTAFKYGATESIFFDEKIEDYWILGHTVEVRTRFYPFRSEHIIWDEDKDDWILEPEIIYEYCILEAMTEKQAKQLELSITSEQHIESEKKEARLRWKELEKKTKQTGKKPALSFEEFMEWHDAVASYRKMKLVEIPNIEYIREYLRYKSQGNFYIYVDAQMYFDCDFSRKPIDEFDLQELNIYRELANIYGYSCKNSDRIFIRKHNAAKQLYINDQLDPFKKMYDEVFKNPDYEEIDTEESPDGYIWDSFHELFTEIMTQNLDTHPSKETFFARLIDLGKLSFMWDYGKMWGHGKNLGPDLIKEISEFCNEFPDKETEAYTPLNGFLLSMVKDLEEDLLDNGAAKKCGYCGGIFPFKANKLYCSAVSDVRDCGKRARDQRYYIKRSLENPTED